MKTRFKRIMSHIPLISNKVKLTISISLLMFAFVLCFVHNFSASSNICLTAMFFSFLGDVALNCVPLNKRPHWMLYLGAFFFMLAHITYATAFYWLISANAHSYFNFGAVFAVFFMLLIFLIIAFSAYCSKNKQKTMTTIVFCVYTIVIAINFVTIFSYSWSFTAITFIGATSFLISDFIIGIETIFKIKSDLLRKLVWFFYPIGQFIIIACH